MKLQQSLTAFVLTLSILVLSPPAEAQLTPGSAAALGMGNNYTAMARGINAISFNPAGLGMPGNPGFSLGLLPVSGFQSSDPIGLTDLSDVEGTLLSPAVKEDWLQRITERGDQDGGFGADLTGLALTVGPFGLQFSTMARGGVALNPEAAELLLYGNAGRTGQAEDFNLKGSFVSGMVVSTVGASFGFPLSVEGEGGATSTFALGGTFKFSMGNVLAYGEDLGSRLTSNPLEVQGNFPLIVSDTSDVEFDHGTGVGLDLGANWKQGKLAIGVAVQNLFHTFEWDIEGMSHYQGEVSFDDDDRQSDFDPRPASEAPQALLDRVAELTFEPTLALGMAYDAAEDLTLTGDFHKRFGEGIEVGPELHLGAGLEYRGIPFLPLRAGAALVTDGFQFGGGLSLAMGPVYLSGAVSFEKGDRDGALAALSLTFGGF
jgi:hypothetical protein